MNRYHAVSVIGRVGRGKCDDKFLVIACVENRARGWAVLECAWYRGGCVELHAVQRRAVNDIGRIGPPDVWRQLDVQCHGRDRAGIAVGVGVRVGKAGCAKGGRGKCHRAILVEDDGAIRRVSHAADGEFQAVGSGNVVAQKIGGRNRAAACRPLRQWDRRLRVESFARH